MAEIAANATNDFPAPDTTNGFPSDTESFPGFNLFALESSFSRSSPPRELPNHIDLNDGEFLKRGPSAVSMEGMFKRPGIPMPTQTSIILQAPAPANVVPQMQPAIRTSVKQAAQLQDPVQVSFPHRSDKPPVKFILTTNPESNPKQERGRVAFNWDCIPNLTRRMKISRWKGKKVCINQGQSKPKKYPKRQDYAQNRPRRNGRFVSVSEATKSNNNPYLESPRIDIQ